MRGKEPVTRKDEQCEESYSSPSSSSSSDYDEFFSSAKSSIDKLYKRLNDTEADLVREKRDNKELAERNKKLEEQLRRAKEREESSKNLKEELKRDKEGEESSKKNLEQTKNKLRKLCTTFAEECDQTCNQQGASQSSKRRKYCLKVGEVNGLFNCPICFQPWNQSEEHNFCSLSCGHFFGRSCITKWISRDGSRGSSTCPVCSSRVSLSDIRHHYVSQIYDGAMKFAQAE
ncbi:hypothetical protein SUGI_0543290 [Cryptomeria japonica]|uniref:uncharacterized protein LOC131075059 n=1 Tax=Cryptomeria japonica TaxID=3369 RepID=UPI002408A693|nr:uncharacterized protein LOC131075059 [Cryptomeria japonica]GLJ27672.1 hypothetical protein SUGI_0543290 [Cryptomeria japonica]